MRNTHVVVGLVLCAIAFGAGYWACYLHMCKRLRAQEERFTRILDIPTHAGEAHNHSAQPSRVSKGRIRNKRRWLAPSRKL